MRYKILAPLYPENAESCLACIEYGQECTRKRPPKKHGTKSRGETVGRSSQIEQEHDLSISFEIIHF
ncbi:hypothetical protein F4819DRAFT_275785 [Hypoxylon fuscum]|nr:hypothetical protein F4819DRAFT_275785 [Hypoxylon fuscum]